MCRKMKNIIALIVILGLIFWQQSAAVRPAYARDEGVGTESKVTGEGNYEDTYMQKEASEGSDRQGSGNAAQGNEPEKEATDEKEAPRESEGESPEEPGEEEKGPSEEGKDPSGEEKNPPEEGKDPSDGEKDPPEGDKDESDKEPGEEDKEEKPPVECFRASIPAEDGRNGYYVTKPEAVILHVSERGVTGYCFTDAAGQKEEGKLVKSGEEIRIREDQFKEGQNHLSVWMEDKEGNRLEEFLLEKTFLVDTKAPSVRIQAPGGQDTWHQKEVFVQISGEDGEKGSQVEEVSCYIGNQKIGGSKQASAGFVISFASAGNKPVPVRARVQDLAGNIAEETCGFYIDQNPPRTSIEGIQDYMITSRPVEAEYRVEEENALGEMSAGAWREDPQGQTTFLEAADWKSDDTVSSAKQILTEDGIYQLDVSACDRAGYESSSKGQVIIDSENPVIRHVDEVDGQYMKSFCWEYPAEEAVEDFTSYTYSVYLDGRPYHIGENVLREGRHVLEVQAEDSAGNRGRAEADFAIDHTAPQVVFADVEDGQTYEEEKTFRVSLKDQEDFIEEIQINGERQKVSAKKKDYSYSMEEYGNYEIQVRAYDRAGNQAVSRMNFAVVQKTGLLHRFAGPLKKILWNPSQTERRGEVISRSSEAAEKPAYPIWLIIAGAAAAGGIAAAVIAGRRRQSA